MALASLGVLTACASNGAVRAALDSDLSTLRRNISEEQTKGALDRGRAREIAGAVASREVYAGTGPGAVARIRSLRACTLPVLPALEARAERQDEAAAEATLVLLAAKRVSPDALARRYDDADSGAWRAVAARASLAPERFAKRRRYFADPDQRVRRAALEAALEAPAALDESALIEAARLDPDAMCRSLATRALGATGDEHAVAALVDLWERADDDDRLNIVDAFADRRALKAGGRSELTRIAESGRGMPAVAAAGLLARVDPSSSAEATNLLARAIKEGSSDEQVLAIETVHLDETTRRALADASHDGDPSVRVAALERLLGVPSERARAFAALRDEAKTADGDAARSALARAGDASVSPGFVKELGARAWQEREGAGFALISLGDYTHAATLLADDDANVRVAVACRILGG
ncbi:MAG TPA: HEAT repeat domain-containing protein [Polyangiaceae bacterium]|nr:HEAT repeat domain-containing protein [Polyangiaceae bacterium]